MISREDAFRATFGTLFLDGFDEWFVSLPEELRNKILDESLSINSASAIMAWGAKILGMMER